MMSSARQLHLPSVARRRSERSGGWIAFDRLGTSRSRSESEDRLVKTGAAGHLLAFNKQLTRRVRNTRAERKTGLQGGFTLLEVLVAIAILGLGLTVILSSQAGLFSSASRGEHLTVASNLLRCKMSEIELTLAQKGFQLLDENDEGDCCDDESDGYTCSWKIERVELPPLPESSLDQDGGAPQPAGSAGLKGPGGLNMDTPPGGPTAGGPLGALMNISATQGASLGDKATPGSVMQQLGSTGTTGMEGMVMGFVYPSLKPMLEASIRRVTVKVMWKEGQRARDLEATQFLTRPQEGMLGTADMLGLGQLSKAAEGLSGATTPGSTPAPTNPGSPAR
jgi:general secretion pathway protein I